MLGPAPNQGELAGPRHAGRTAIQAVQEEPEGSGNLDRSRPRSRLQDLARLTPARHRHGLRQEGSAGSSPRTKATSLDGSSIESGYNEFRDLLSEMRGALESGLADVRRELQESGLADVRRELQERSADRQENQLLEAMAGVVETGLMTVEAKVDSMRGLLNKSPSREDNLQEGSAILAARLEKITDQLDAVVRRLDKLDQRPERPSLRLSRMSVSSTKLNCELASAGPTPNSETTNNGTMEATPFSGMGSSFPSPLQASRHSALGASQVTQASRVSLSVPVESPPSPDNSGKLSSEGSHKLTCMPPKLDHSDIWQSRLFQKMPTERKSHHEHCHPCCIPLAAAIEKRIGYTIHCCNPVILINVFSVFNIVTNSVYIGYAEDLAMHNALHTGETNPGWLWYVELAFAILFGLELGLRLLFFGKKNFHEKEILWTTLDAVFFVTAFMSLILRTRHVSSWRMVSFFKILRAVRLFRAFRGLHALRVMVAMIVSALSSVCWAMVFLFLFVYMYGVFLMQGLSRHILEADTSLAWRENVAEHFGTIWATVTTLISSITGGEDWLRVALPLQTLSTGYFVSFVLFVIFMVFGVMNILTGIFVQNAKQMSKVDRDLVIEEQISNARSHTNQLRWIFQQADSDNNGILSIDELMTHLRSQSVQGFLRALDVQPSDALGVFNLLDVDAQGDVTIDSFIFALLRLQGTAKNVDMVTMLYETKRNSAKWDAYVRFIADQFKAIMEALDIHGDAIISLNQYLNEFDIQEETADDKRGALRQAALNGVEVERRLSTRGADITT